MKKTLLVLTASAFLFSCAENTDNDTDDTVDTTTVMQTPQETISQPADANMTKDGMMTKKDGKMMVMQGGAWVAMEKDMSLANGSKVMMNGEMMHADGEKHKVTEGMMIDAEGNMMNADGSMIPHEPKK